MSFILYEDDALVVLDKPAGCSSEEGVPQRLREQWGKPDAYVGVIHRLDTGVSGLMVYAKTPQAAAALSRQVTRSQEAYAVQDGRAEGTPAAPRFIKQYRAVIAGGPDEALPAEGTLRDHLFKDSRKGRVFPVSRPPQGCERSCTGVSHCGHGRRWSVQSGGHHPPHRADPSDPGAVCLPEASALGRWQVRQPRQGGHRPAERPAAVLPPGERREDGIRVGHASRGTVGFVQSAVPVTPLSLLRSQLPLKGEPLAYRVIFSYRLRLQSSRALLF